MINPATRAAWVRMSGTATLSQKVPFVTGPIANSDSEARPVAEIRQQAVAEGQIELNKTALLKVAHGETNPEEVLRVVRPEYLELEEV